MDSDPGGGYRIVVIILDDSTMLWAVDGIRHKKED